MKVQCMNYCKKERREMESNRLNRYCEPSEYIETWALERYGYAFGWRVTKEFLHINQLSCMVTSLIMQHQVFSLSIFVAFFFLFFLGI